MQVQDEKKRQRILDVAAELFCEKPYHEVRLSDVAAKASVGKGTLYVYFQSKEDLFQGVLFGGLADLIDELTARLAGQNCPPDRTLELIVREMVAFGSSRPQLFELLRSSRVSLGSHPRWEEKRKALADLIAATLRRGVEEGVFHDPHPELTALFVPGMVRSAMLYAPDADHDTIAEHILRVLRRTLAP